MKFILLVDHDESAFEQGNKETKGRYYWRSRIRLCRQLDVKRGIPGHASPGVHPAATATIVRVREGKAFVTDRPFIETREQMAGYFADRGEGSRGSQPGHG